MDRLNEMLSSLDALGGNSRVLLDTHTAHLVADGHRVLSRQGVAGVELYAEETAEAIVAKVVVNHDAQVAHPIHLCFGMLARMGMQRVEMEITLEDNATATFIAHCLFTNAQFAQHAMDATIHVGNHATLSITEGHYHGPYGGIEVLPQTTIKVAPYGRFFSDFSLTQGLVGKLDMDYRLVLEAHAVGELTCRVFGHGTDAIKIRDDVYLAGEAAKSVVKTRVALEEQATAEVIGIMDGAAPGARGHLDCMEIVKDQALAQSTPVVKVSNPLAKVTHEAAIGTVDKAQLETLLAHGLSPDQAVDIIVSGMLR
jgi:Fe-S cluster assembly scaffold protein SufB